MLLRIHSLLGDCAACRFDVQPTALTCRLSFDVRLAAVRCGLLLFMCSLLLIAHPASALLAQNVI
jgi:hypothetical protein